MAQKERTEKKLMLKFSFFEKAIKVNEIYVFYVTSFVDQISTDQVGCYYFFKTYNLKREGTSLPLLLLNSKVIRLIGQSE